MEGRTETLVKKVPRWSPGRTSTNTTYFPKPLGGSCAAGYVNDDEQVGMQIGA